MNRIVRFGIAFLPAFFLVAFASAQFGGDNFDKAVKFKASVVPGNTVSVGDVVTIQIEATIQPGYHMYSARQTDKMEMLAALFELDDAGNQDVALVGKLDDKGHRETAFDDIFGDDISLYHEKVTYLQKVKITGPNPKITGFLRYQVCDDSRCIPGSYDVNQVFKVVEKAPEAAKDPATGAIKQQPGTPASANDLPQQAVTPTPEPGKVLDSDTGIIQTEAPVVIAAVETVPIETQEPEKTSLWVMLLKGMLFGLGSVLTPCVFPMIPLTVSIFTKLSSKPGSAMRNGLLYGGSIVFIYTVLGLAISMIFGADILRQVAVSPVANTIIFAAIFIFALSFLGWFEITLPASWSTSLSQKSQRGGILGIFLMALTLVIVSFSCTGPLVGTALFEAASGNSVIGPTVSMFGFSLALAIPFVLFSIFPQWLQSMRSGSWLNEVKVTLGFLELALALIYLSRADLVMNWGILDREIMLGAWVVIFAMLGFYLLGKIRMKSDSPVDRIGVGRLMLAVSSFWFTLYLIPGLWGAPLNMLSGYLPTSNNEMGVLLVESLNLPQAGNASAEVSEICAFPDKISGHLSEHTPKGFCAFYDLEQGMAYAKKVNKPVFLDFTGHTCANCRYLEKNMWIDPEIMRMIAQDYVLISLYTDDRVKLPQMEVLPDGTKLRTVGDKWISYEQSTFQQNAQPYYVLLGHDGKPLVAPTGFNPPLDLVFFRDYFSRGLKSFKAQTSAPQVN